MLQQSPSGLLTICFIFHSLRLSNICQGQTAVVPLFLGAHRTDHRVGLYLIRVSADQISRLPRRLLSLPTSLLRS